MFPITNLSPIQENDIEYTRSELGQKTNSCCSCSRNWQKIVGGTLIVANLGSLALLTYGVAINNPIFVYIGAGCGVGTSISCCLLSCSPNIQIND